MTIDIEKIKALDLTSKDFDLMVKGLDVLPRHHEHTDVIYDELAQQMFRGNPILQAQVKRENELKRSKKKQEMDLLEEDAKILQGKLITIKRFMIENQLMAQL